MIKSPCLIAFVMLPSCFSFFFNAFSKRMLKDFTITSRSSGTLKFKSSVQAVNINATINPQGKFDWVKSQQFWQNVLKLASTVNSSDSTIANHFLFGDNQYGITRLKDINQAGYRSGEFESKDSRYTKTKTYIIRFGYNGMAFHGYQSQRNLSIHTVEDILFKIIKKAVVAAGRTDRGVSAISQIASFSSSIENFHELILSDFRREKVCQEGNLTVYDCVRVPRKFNARSSATWRRYLYVVPLVIDIQQNSNQVIFTTIEDDTLKYSNNNNAANINTKMKMEINIMAIALALKSLEGLSLPYNAFAYHGDRTGGDGLKDVCTVFRTTCYLFDMNDPFNTDTVIDLSAEIAETDSQNENAAKLSSNIQEKLYNALHRNSKIEIGLCIELVGSRFLRQMVRRLVSTVVREAIRHPVDRTSNSQVLVDICKSGNRNLVAPPFPGEALCLSGVGYDCVDLSFYKYMPKDKRNEVLNHYNLNESPISMMSSIPLEKCI